MAMPFGAAYYPEHRDISRWDHDLDTMAAAHVTALRVGEFAWKRFELTSGRYDFAWMDDFAARAAKRGISLLMCPPLRTVPAWLVEQDPTILIVNEQGQRLEFGSRYTFCINHPLLRQRGLALAERMASHYASTPNILGWHLDNEYGDEPYCHCSVCKAKWQTYLAGRYGEVAVLNKAWGLVFWGLEFDSFAQVPTPRVTKTIHAPGLLQAWRQFRSDCTVEMIGLHAAAVRKHDKRTITTNYQNLWQNRTDYYDAARHLDVCGTNYYPLYGDKANGGAFGLATMRSFKRKNFQVHELRCGAHAMAGEAGNTPAPGELIRLTLHTIANGADAIYYFRWRSCPFGAEQNHGSITDYDGLPRSVYGEVQELGAKLAKLWPMLEGTTVKSDVAILYDFPTRWMQETGSIWEGPPDLYMKHCRTIYKGVRGLGVNCDAVGRGQDFSQYKVLLVPGLAGMDDGLVQRLCDFVNGGGTLVWHPFSGIKDVDTNIYPTRLHPKLAELFGARAVDFATAGEDTEHHFTWAGKNYVCGLMFEHPVLGGASAVGSYTDGWWAGMPAVVERSQGRGRAIYVATYAQADFYQDLAATLLDAAGCRRIVANVPPPEVEVTQRSSGDGRKLTFLLNTSASPQTVKLDAPMHDLWADAPAGQEISLPPHGVAVLK